MGTRIVKGKDNEIGSPLFIRLGYCYHIFAFFLLTLSLVECKTAIENKYVLEFSYASVSPDNFTQEGIVVNGKFPGETLRFSTNETYEVKVVNNLDHDITIHFHGLLQKGTVESDGVPYVTQYPIPRRASHFYKMHTGNQSGTFMYHAHTGLDLVWAFGALVIEDPWKVEDHPDYYYDADCVIFVSQLWHTPISAIAEGIVGKPFEDVPDTDSILVTSPTCALQQGNITRFEIIPVIPGLTYRFRVIAMGMDSMLNFKIHGHTFKVIEVDGVLVDPVVTDVLFLNSAQRYSILLTMNQTIDNYLMESKMVPGPGPRDGVAILHYDGAPYPAELVNDPERDEGETEEEELTHWVLNELHPSTIINNSLIFPVPEVVDREIIISSLQNEVDGYIKFDINGVIHKTPTIPLLHQALYGTNITANPENGVYEIREGERVQIVFQNRMDDGNECEQHPWHTHGHTFYIVGEGADAYDPINDRRLIEEQIASGKQYLMRDVLTMYPAQDVLNNITGTPCGWIAVRFIADNPGLWLVHCHLTPHQMMGKEFILWEH